MQETLKRLFSNKGSAVKPVAPKAPATLVLAKPDAPKPRGDRFSSGISDGHRPMRSAVETTYDPREWLDKHRG